MRRIIVTGAVLVLVLAAPLAALAGDGSVAVTATKWRIRITAIETELRKSVHASSPAASLPAATQLRKAALQAKSELTAQTPSTGIGRRLKSLSLQAFANLASAGALYLQAVRRYTAHDIAHAQADFIRSNDLGIKGDKQLAQVDALLPGLIR